MLLKELNIILDKVNLSPNDFDVFIETGSYIGETLGQVKSSFKKLISIEITDKYYKICSDKFASDDNVELVKGDCVKELPKLIKEYNNDRVLFFLDGHYSAGDTGKNEMDVPLIEELKLINNLQEKSALIIIDDADLFEFKDQYLSWGGINEENILNAIDGRIEEYFYVENIKPSNKKKRLIIKLKNK
jgi:hypothetical protein